MESWFTHPAAQSAVAPLVLAVIVSAALGRTRLSGLAVVAGTLACVQLAIGLDLFPLNATRRIVLVALLGAGLGIAVDLVPSLRRMPVWVAAVLAASASIWVLYTALSHRDAGAALLLGGGLALYCAFLAWGFDRLEARPVRAGAAALGTGLSVGAAATISASASLGQIGLSVGAAAGGFLLVQMLRGGLAAGRSLTLPTALTTGLVSAAAVVLAKLPWTALPIVAVIPLVTASPIANRAPAWLQAIIHGALAVAVGAGAVAIAWAMAGESASSGY